MRPRHLVWTAGALLAVLVVAGGWDAFTASSTVGASKVGLENSTFNASDLEPDACTVSVTSVVVDDAKAGRSFTATAQHQLVLGTQNADTVTLQKNDCFVGGGPTSGGSYDRVTGQSNSGGDQCIITSRATETNCTVVQRSP